MEFKDGVSVYTMDGKKAGNLNRVVIDPGTKEVTHIVVQKGLLFKDDKVIAVDKVASASQDKIDLNCSTEELGLMSPLEVPQYVPTDVSDTHVDTFEPLAGGVFTHPTPEHPIIEETKRTIPDELVALKEGARVLSADDEHVGNVEHVYTNSETGKVTHFIVTQGILFVTRRAIPIEWVKMITDDEVYLSVGTRNVESLPEVQG